jgi:hypothetical protein
MVHDGDAELVECVRTVDLVERAIGRKVIGRLA